MSSTEKPGDDVAHDEAADAHDAERERHTQASWYDHKDDPQMSELDTRDASIDGDAAEVDRDRARLERARNKDS
jgi:hypothetical protein